MAQRLLNVRIRPARVTVLISRDAQDPDLLLAFEFFSKLWGGRFGQLLAVDPQACDDVTRFRLGSSRPEFIYGIGLDDQHWALAVRQACQPRSYGRLRPEFVRGIRQTHVEDYYLVDHALIHLFRTREQYKGRKQTLRLVSPEASSPLVTFCAATFGIHHQNLRKDYFDQDTAVSDSKTTAFIELATEFVKEWQQSWLDVTGHQLNPRIESSWGSGQLSPTVVLVGHRIQDLCLFWNLRSASDTTYPAWIIPIPVEGASDPAVLGKLKEWLLAFLPYGPRPSYCLVTSQTVAEEVCRRVATDFQAVLAGSPIEAVDYEPSRNRLPVVIPYEYEAVWPVDVTGRKLTIQPPRPKAFDDVGSSRVWLVDLLKDMKTGRAVKEMQLPPSPVVFELLNGPCPPGFEHTAIPRTGDGVDSINIRCSGSKEVVSIHLPSGEEILEEVLREHGVEPLKDEKRSSYLPVIRKFGGLHLAAEAFTGKSGLILATLQNEAKTAREIKGACQLGDGTVPGKSYLERIEWIFQRESERMKRVGRCRFAQYARHQSPENLRLASVLEYWADRSVLTREWKVGPCSRCNRASFVPKLDIQERVVCPACGNRISLPESVPLGYALHRTVRLAVREGIVPVVLTGRFLRNMSNNGFFWLPGVKYKIGDQPGDIDLLACCDGHLVFCECKQLDATPAGTMVWDDVVVQFLETAAVAKRCGARLAVLAALVNDYPHEVQHRIAAQIGSSIPYLLLTKQDLEAGHRDVQDGGITRNLGDILPLPFPERPREATDKPRTINMGWGIYTR
jgi:DNA-directed RNA polymerase subunit RPC12/RpoP